MFHRFVVTRIALSFLLWPAGLISAAHPLQQVEDDQAGGLRSSDDIFNRNIAVNRRPDFTRASSYKAGRFGFYAHDGDKRTAWVPGPEQTEAVLDISWGLAETIDRVIVLEKNPKGIESLTLELYDGHRWQPVAPTHPEERGEFRFPPRPASGLRIGIEASGNAGIAEVEVYNTGSDAPLPQYGSAALIAAMTISGPVILFDGSPFLYSRAGG